MMLIRLKYVSDRFTAPVQPLLDWEILISVLGDDPLALKSITLAGSQPHDLIIVATRRWTTGSLALDGHWSRCSRLRSWMPFEKGASVASDGRMGQQVCAAA